MILLLFVACTIIVTSVATDAASCDDDHAHSGPGKPLKISKEAKKQAKEIMDKFSNKKTKKVSLDSLLGSVPFKCPVCNKDTTLATVCKRGKKEKHLDIYKREQDKKKPKVPEDGRD